MTAPSAATTRKTSPRVPPIWNLPEAVDAGVLAAFAGSLDLGMPAARVLWSRGLRDTAAARDFLSPSLDLLHDPMLMAGMARAVDRLTRAIADRRKPL